MTTFVLATIVTIATLAAAIFGGLAPAGTLVWEMLSLVFAGAVSLAIAGAAALDG